MKKAQDGGGAAVLLLVIGAFILIYVLLLPEGDRNELLDTESVDDNDTVATGKLLLNESPGVLLEQDDDNIKHNLGSATVFVRTDEVELEQLNPFILSSSSDTRQTRIIDIDVEGTTRNAQLTFNVVEGEGQLYVLLDGEEVFRGEPTGQVAPIALEELNANSIIVIGVESPSALQFLSTNEYSIANFKITATLDTFDAQDSTVSFVITDDEFERAESGYITYFTNCANAATVRSGQLSLRLNNRELFSGLPDCDSPARIEILPSDLIAGRNLLDFSTDAGSYILDRIIVTTEVEEGIPIAYNFNVNENDYARVESETDDVKVYFSFVDNNERKSAELTVNSATFTIDTRRSNFTQAIPAVSIKEGSNFISISPKSTFALPLLEVRLS